jgi:hypothetical protein
VTSGKPRDQSDFSNDRLLQRVITALNVAVGKYDKQQRDAEERQKERA